MSKRFLRWVETWIEENIPPGANPDIESHEARAKRLSEKLFAEAAAAGFTNSETAEERQRVPPLAVARTRRAHRLVRRAHRAARARQPDGQGRGALDGHRRGGRQRGGGHRR